MNFANYLSFVLITFTITYSPGPMTMFLMNNGIQNGLKKTLPALYGASTAYILSIIVYAFGILKLIEFLRCCHTPRLLLINVVVDA